MYIILIETDGIFPIVLGLFTAYTKAVSALHDTSKKYNKSHLLTLDDYNFEIHYDLFDDGMDWKLSAKIVKLS